MKIKKEKLKTFIYPAAFILIALLSLAYKLLVNGTGDTFISTIKGESIIMPSEASYQDTEQTAEPSLTEDTSAPARAGAMMRLMFPTAFETPFPPNRVGSPSLSSSASNSPVEAPEGEAPRPTVPSASVTSASTVGLPLESMISLPYTFTI